MKRWPHYFKYILNEESEANDRYEEQILDEDIEHLPTLSDVRVYIRRMKNKRAPKIDNIIIEWFKYGFPVEIMLLEITPSIQKISETMRVVFYKLLTRPSRS